MSIDGGALKEAFDDGGALKEAFDHIRRRLLKLETLETALPLLTIRLTNSFSQTIQDNTPTIVDLDTIVHETIPDMANLFDSSITVPESGIYRIQAKVRFTTSGTGTRILRILVNAVAIDEVEGRTNIAGFPTQLDLIIDASLTEGDIITAEVSQDSGGPLDILLDVSSPLLSVSKVHVR